MTQPCEEYITVVKGVKKVKNSLITEHGTTTCGVPTDRRCANCGYYLCRRHSRGHFMYKADVLTGPIYRFSKAVAEGANAVDENTPHL